jgi:hypothetical protein
LVASRTTAQRIIAGVVAGATFDVRRLTGVEVMVVATRTAERSTAAARTLGASRLRSAAEEHWVAADEMSATMSMIPQLQEAHP